MCSITFLSVFQMAISMQITAHRVNRRSRFCRPAQLTCYPITPFRIAFRWQNQLCGVTGLETCPGWAPQRQEVALVMRTVEVGTNHCLTYSTHKITQQNRKRNGTQNKQKAKWRHHVTPPFFLEDEAKKYETWMCTLFLSMEFKQTVLPRFPHLVSAKKKRTC